MKFWHKSRPESTKERAREHVSEIIRDPPAPGFSVKHMDCSLDPRNDFYSYCVGEWLRNNPIPADKSRWSAFNELADWNLKLLGRIVNDCVADRKAAKGSPSQLVGDLYSSAMDTDKRERLKFSPIGDLLKSVSKIKSKEELLDRLPELHKLGVSAFFEDYVGADQKASDTYAFHLYQGGLSLPDREYYLSDKFAQLREQFQDHMADMFVMSGAKQADAHRHAQTVLAIEKELAQSARTRTELRNAEKNYNRIQTSFLDSKYDSLSLSRYLRDLGVTGAQHVVVSQPEFFEKLNELIKSRTVEDLKIYLTWHVISSYAPMLHKEAREKSFDFFGKKLNGQEMQEPQWKRSIRLVDNVLGDALGSLYVSKHFTQETRSKVLYMVNDIMEVFRERLQKITWMDEQTRKKALEKLDAFGVNIGYPEKFRDYSGLLIKPDDYVGNMRRYREFETKRQVSRVAKPLDRSEWFTTPPTVNAYYSPTKNEITFPAGILQPPFFDPDLDDAVNYGAIGAVIGHEITHGFDDQGRNYDAKGNISDWWSEEAKKRFNELAKKVVAAYGSNEVFPGFFINGELTLGENIADLGGVSIAYEALKKRLEKDPSKRKDIDGFTPEQRFFISYAQVWRGAIKEQLAKRFLVEDPHSPSKYRVIMPATRNPAFDEAFPAENGADSTVNSEPLGLW